MFVEELGPRLVELPQTEYTRVGLGAQWVSALSRIDRVCTTLDAVAVIDLDGVAGLVWPLELNDPVSDHSPVFARLVVRQRGRLTIPQWVADSLRPLFVAPSAGVRRGFAGATLRRAVYFFPRSVGGTVEYGAS